MSTAEAWAVHEAAGAALDDERRRLSLARTLTGLAGGVGQSWSQALGPGLRQAAGDLVGRSQLGYRNLLAGHVSATVERCAAHPLVLLPADSSALNFTGLGRQVKLGGLGDGGTSEGLWAHAVYALTPAGQPLGVLDVRLWVRPGGLPPKEQRPYEERESFKWEQSLRAVSWLLPPGTRGVVITDRESDVFEYLSAPRAAHIDLLVRATQPRRSLEGVRREWGSVLSAGAGRPPLAILTVRVPRRQGQRARVATVVVRATQVRLPSPSNWPAERRCELSLRVVRVDECAPPAGVKPVAWVLLTTLPVHGAAEAMRVVSWYARRWRIETLHEVLKTRAVDVESLRLRSLEALKAAIGLCFVVAWRAMDLCYAAREHPESLARERLGEDELTVLAVYHGGPVTTLGQAVGVIARLGGWEGYASSPPYGPKVVARGLEKLATMVAYERLRRGGAASCDPT